MHWVSMYATVYHKSPFKNKLDNLAWYQSSPQVQRHKHFRDGEHLRGASIVHTNIKWIIFQKLCQTACSALLFFGEWVTFLRIKQLNFPYMEKCSSAIKGLDTMIIHIFAKQMEICDHLQHAVATLLNCGQYAMVKGRPGQSMFCIWLL